MPPVIPTSATVWVSWNGSETWTYTGTTTTPLNAWTNWNADWSITGGSYYNTNTIIYQPTWTAWNNYHEYSTVIQRPVIAPRRQVAEGDAARAARLAEARAEQREADARAEELLMAHLDAQQKRDVLEHGWFEVISDKGRRWRIRRDGTSGNVDLMPAEGDVRDASYCAHGRGLMPAGDHHLIQKLALEANEDDFVQVANVHYARSGVDIPRRARVA